MILTPYIKGRLDHLLPAGANGNASFLTAILPILTLLGGIVLAIACSGPLAAADWAPWVLLLASAVGLACARRSRTLSRRGLVVGLCRSARQVLPAIPILACIALLATTWMTSGIVPLLIGYGLELLSPAWFLAAVCAVCAVVSVVTGSSWSTIATIGVAFIGIGEALGQSPGWTAGAVISGAYFGDKMSPLSDTTVVASATCGVDLFKHIRYMLFTTLPAMAIALGVFTLRGLTGAGTGAVDSQLGSELGETYHLTPWLLAVPALTIILLACRVGTTLTLGVSALAGLVATFIWQPSLLGSPAEALSVLWHGYAPSTGREAVDALTATGGLWGIWPVVWLIACAMIFGGVMMGTGLLAALTRPLTGRLRGRTRVVGASVATGLTLNATTADQYLSLIINGNMFRSIFQRNRLEPRLLSRSLEDSVSATSPLIPWSSCGVTQASVLGVATMTYLPYCVFNYLTPVMALVVAWLTKRKQVGIA